MLAAVGGQAHAASAVNLDSEPRTLIVTEGGSKTELAVAAGETVEFCPTGCFVTHAQRRPRSADRLGDHRDFRRPGQDQVTATAQQSAKAGRIVRPFIFSAKASLRLTAEKARREARQTRPLNPP